MAEWEQVAEALYLGWVAYERMEKNTISPKWRSLHEGLKDHWREMAQRTINVYETF